MHFPGSLYTSQTAAAVDGQSRAAASLPTFDPSYIEVTSLKVFYDEASYTRTRETSNMLQYESQHFKCKAQIRFKDSYAQENWSVGLVQACDFMYLENRYGQSGSSFWEFHPLKSGRHQMVNDSDGRQYPFYSRVNSKCEVRRGVLNETTVSLQYDDHFYPTVAWELPQCHSERLTDVIRLQDFWVWLVAIRRGQRGGSLAGGTKHGVGIGNIASGQGSAAGHSRLGAAGSTAAAAQSNLFYDQFEADADLVYVLRSMRWRYNLHMSFDPYQQVGRRLVGIADRQMEQPYVCSFNQGLPVSALCAPHCNAGQSLIWYPAQTTNARADKPRLLVPPYQIIAPWNSWCGEMVSPGAPIYPGPENTAPQFTSYGPGNSNLLFAAQKPKDCQLVFDHDEDRLIGLEWTDANKPGKLLNLNLEAPHKHRSTSQGERSKSRRRSQM